MLSVAPSDWDVLIVNSRARDHREGPSILGAMHRAAVDLLARVGLRVLQQDSRTKFVQPCRNAILSSVCSSLYKAWPWHAGKDWW